MLNVRCEACKAPYQVDERRVPDTGLKMRCPSCGHSFAVSASGAPPAQAVDLPEIARSKKPPPLPPAAFSRDSADLPGRLQKAEGLSDLPMVLGSGASLPAVASSDLPAVAEISLPTLVQPSVPPPAGGAFGDIDLPLVQESLPPSDPLSPPRPQAQEPDPPRVDPFGDFGELDLPTGDVVSARGLDIDVQEVPKRASVVPTDFLAGVTPVPPPLGAAAPNLAPSGGMPFTEVDLGLDMTAGSHGAADAPAQEQSEGVATAPQALSPEVASVPSAGASIAGTASPAAPWVAPAPRSAWKPRRPKLTKTRVAVFCVLTLSMAGGASLQLTRHGAFAYLFFSDLIRSGEYQRAEEEAIRNGAQTLGVDTYDQSRANVESLVRAHAALSRVDSLAALAAFEESVMTLRFGPDPRESGSGSVLLKVLPLDRAIPYRTAALAADAGAHGDIEKARRTLETAKREQSGDAKRRGFVRELDILSGELALGARDYKDALASFTKAHTARPDARAAFGLARAKWGAGDRDGSIAAIEKVRAESSRHVGARVLRATIAEHREGEEAVAIEQLAPVLDGPLRAFAAPLELAEAYATRGWLAVHRGALLDARSALDDALKLNPRSVRALRGQGELFMREGRYTEALTRFETALQTTFTPDATADVARAMLKLERSQEAKKKLSDGVEKFPNHPTLLALLGQVERNLGNLPAAELQIRAAVAAVDPSRRDAVLPFVTLSSYLSARGQAKEGQVVLEEARAKLPDSAALQKAFGEVAEAQGDLERALKHYKAALTREATDHATRFRTEVVLRNLRRFDEASQELAKIEAADKDFPGLSVERGLLFEANGQIERAIEAFKAALEKAPNDLDLQLRVGSAYVTIGRDTEALAMLAKVLELRPQSAEVNYAVGRAHMLRGRASEADALRYLKQAVALDPNKAEYHLYFAWAANEATPPQLGLAREEVDKALAIDQGLCEGYWQRGVLARKGGSVNDALTDLKHALELCPARYEIYGSLAELYEDRNEIPAALAAWAIAMRVGHTNAFWHYRYGRLLSEHGKAGEAGAQFEAASKGLENVTPKPAWYVQLEFHLGETYARAGKKQQAVAHFQKYLDNAPPKAPDRKAAQKYVDQESK